MPWNDPDPQDPSVLVGVTLPAGPEAMREMAAAFAEEFAALGWPEERILALFRAPHYQGPHQAWKALGEVEVVRLVREAAAVFGSFRVRVVDAPGDGDLLTIEGGGR